MLIDVNTREQFAKETIPGAINIPLEELDEGLKNIPKDTVLVFACNRGPRSSQGGEDCGSSRLYQLDFLPDHEMEGWGQSDRYSTISFLI
jgi:hypothetical protein